MKYKLPGIGLRIIKSALAIALCFAVDLLRGDSGIVFYSQLSALWCMQAYRQNTKSNALQRLIGTIIGAVYGLFILLLNQKIAPLQINQRLFSEIAISLMIIVVLYTTVILKKKQASYFSCVVFLSIVINHIGDANPYLFVWNRFLDTVIGIIIGVSVNDFVLPSKKDRETLFISTMDDTLLKKDEKLSDYSIAELNRLIDDGLRFTIATMRTPAIIVENLGKVDMRYPVIAMDGAVLYDMKTGTYPMKYVISPSGAKELREFLNRYTRFYFTNIIIDDTLLIYYQPDTEGILLDVFHQLRHNPYRNFIKRYAPDDESVVYFMLLDHKDKQKTLYHALSQAGYCKKYKIIIYDSDTYPGYSYIKIFNKNATLENMIDNLKTMTDLQKTTTIGTIEGKYDITVSGEKANEAVKIIKRFYEKRNIKSTPIKSDII